MTLAEALRTLCAPAAGSREAAAEWVAAELEQLAGSHPRWYEPPHDRRDAIQRCLLRLLQARKPPRAETDEQARAYLACMLRNEFRDRMRRQRVQRAHAALPEPGATGIEHEDDDGEPPRRVRVDRESPELLVESRRDVGHAYTVFFAEILPELDARSPRQLNREVVQQLFAIARGDTTVEAIARADGADFVKARNRFYQNAHRTLQRLGAAIQRRPEDEQPLLLEFLNGLRIR